MGKKSKRKKRGTAEQVEAWAMRRTPAGWTWLRLELPATMVPQYLAEEGEPNLRVSAIGEIVGRLEDQEGAL